MRNISFVRNSLGTLLMAGNPIYSVKKINFESVYVPYPADVSGQKSGALIRHSNGCGSSVMVSAQGINGTPKSAILIFRENRYLSIERLFISNVKKKSGLEVLWYGSLDQGVACPCTGPSIGLIIPFACWDKFGVIRGFKWFSQNLKILFQENKLDILEQECLIISCLKKVRF